MKNNIVFFAAGFSTTVLVVALISNAIRPTPPTPDAPIPVVTLNDSIVRVVCHTRVGVLSGYGIVVTHAGEEFVLTSRMLFNGNGPVLVNGVEARVLLQDDVCELVALGIDTNLPGVSLEDAPEGELSVYGETITKVTKGRAINPAWFFLKDIPADKITGAPLIVDETVVGLVIGRSQTNDDVAIGVTSEAMLDFADGVVL